MSETTLHILVRLSAHATIGLGHAVRTGALLRALNLPCRLTVVGQGELWREFLPPALHWPLDDEDSKSLAEAASTLCPDLVLVDYPYPSREFWKLLRLAGAPIAVVDDWGGKVPADLVINGTVIDAYHRYEDLPAGARVLAGPDYALVRSEFAAHPWSEKDGGILIVIGSGQAAAKWAFFLAGQWPCGRMPHIEMVVGKAFPELPALERCCAERGIHLLHELSANELAKRLAGASVALITGGMIVYEVLTVGLPAVAFPQVSNMIAEVEWFAERGVLINLGPDGGMDMDKIVQAVEGLRVTGKAMSVRQRNLIDGGGLKRAAEALLALLSANLSSR